uniref:beta-1,3-glucan-binding protein-like n=1 Tax=Styela clava TaxID=7725 RepID=UPI001939677B|nr:beta-1,3-glucan-binding protein-like [Styela clava]
MQSSVVYSLTICAILLTAILITIIVVLVPESDTLAAPPSCSAYPCDATCDMKVSPCNGLVFEENFDTFDLQRWQHEITMSGGGNWEFQYYTNNRTNSYVRDNTLFIKPTLTADHYGESFLSSGVLDLWGGSPADFCTGNAFWGCQRTGTPNNYINPVQSARIRSVNSFAIQYGRIEVVAKMPSGDWLWPAIWMLPRDNRYGGWPASGEIDIIESRGNINLTDAEGVSKGRDNMGMTLHWGPYFPLNGYPKTTIESHPASGTYASAFHTWVVDWTAEYIDLFVDGKLLRRVDPGPGGFFDYGEFEKEAPGIDNPWANSNNKMTPFDQEFYILINVAVGGTNGFFPDSWINAPREKPWKNDSPTAMKDFWLKKDEWYPSWQPDVDNGENAAMQVRSIKVWAK